MIHQTLYSCLYLSDRSLYQGAPELKAFIEGMLFVVNTFYRNSLMTTVLRDEDINFPPTNDQFSHASHPILADLTLDGIVKALIPAAAGASEEFEPYLSWMRSLVLSTAWTLEPKSVDFMRVVAKPAGGNKKNKNKKKQAAAEAAVNVE